MKWMNELDSFHRIGTVAVPKASRRRVGTDWDRLGRGRLAGWRRCNCPKTKKPHVLGNGKRAPGHLPHSSEANMHVPAYRTRKYEGTRVSRYTPSTPTDTSVLFSPRGHVPVPRIMPQTGGQRAFREVHPGPLRFHPPTPKAPSESINCCVL